MVQVAAYCRVSTDREDQANSFVSQQQYFKEYIERCPSWNLYKIYADEGITGTSTKNRTAFNQMMEDARQGCFQLILTKEVSRFSRNILDTISYTRELKALGIAVVFANDNINTLEPDAELRLSIMASLAQEESRRTSSRVKWGQSRRMEQGVVFGRSLLGYDVKGGDLIVNPKEAELVKLIFSKYGLEKKGTTVIARELREAGYRTHRGNVRWSPSHIVKILKNEKYVGDLVQKKTFTPDYLNHAKKTNHGEEKLVVLVNHHEPIVDRELWELVQTELKKRSRSEKKPLGIPTDTFSAEKSNAVNAEPALYRERKPTGVELPTDIGAAIPPYQRAPGAWTQTAAKWAATWERRFGRNWPWKCCGSLSAHCSWTGKRLYKRSLASFWRFLKWEEQINKPA